MSFNEFSKHWLTILSMIYFSKRVKETVLLMSFDDVSKHGFTLLSIGFSLVSSLRRLFC